jgi:hypothetical protein
LFDNKFPLFQGMSMQDDYTNKDMKNIECDNLPNKELELDSPRANPGRLLFIHKCGFGIVALLLGYVFLLGFVAISKVTKAFPEDWLSLQNTIISHVILGLVLFIHWRTSPQRQFLGCRIKIWFWIIYGVYIAGVLVGLYIYLVP